MIPDVSDLVGVRFARMGRDARGGLDCLGLVREVLYRAGYDVPDEDSLTIWSFFQEEPNWQGLPLAILGFKPDGKYVSHLAVYLGHGIAIHADSIMGKVVLCPVHDMDYPVAVAYVPCKTRLQ